MDIDRIISIVRSLREESSAVPTNNASSGAIAGLPPDEPIVRKKKKPRYIYGGTNSRKNWMV
jgi:hypothetical protein